MNYCLGIIWKELCFNSCSQNNFLFFSFTAFIFYILSVLPVFFSQFFENNFKFVKIRSNQVCSFCNSTFTEMVQNIFPEISLNACWSFINFPIYHLPVKKGEKCKVFRIVHALKIAKSIFLSEREVQLWQSINKNWIVYSFIYVVD